MNICSFLSALAGGLLGVGLSASLLVKSCPLLSVEPKVTIHQDAIRFNMTLNVTELLEEEQMKKVADAILDMCHKGQLNNVTAADEVDNSQLLQTINGIINENNTAGYNYTYETFV